MVKTLRKSKHILNSFLINCPVCGEKNFSVEQVLDEIPYFGEVLETFAHCKSCGYKAHDILPLGENKNPKKQEIEVSKDNLGLRVVKSKYCSIEIPEIGLKITPGPESESYISNVEGVLDRVIDSLKRISKIKHDKEKELKKQIEKLNSAKEGKVKLTIIFNDSTGQSAVIRKVK